MWACLVAGCAPEPPAPRWTALADGYTPRRLVQQLPALLEGWRQHLPGAPALRANAVDDGSALWLKRDVPPEAWVETDIPGLYKTPRLIGSCGEPREGGHPLRLMKDGKSLRFLFDRKLIEVMRRTMQKREVTPDTFFEYHGELYVALDEPPQAMEQQVYVRLGDALEDSWRVTQRRFAGDGFSVLPGMSVEIPLPPGGERTLHVATAAQATLVDLPPERDDLRFQVWLEGRALLDERQANADAGSVRWHAIALPATDQATLRFEVHGSPSLSAFLAPVVSPRAIGSPGVRPWSDPRPDIVIFLADTFRADNLTAYGGERDVTPQLDAFAARSARFLQAWSPASWTLPAHASLFSGVFPYQHDAHEKTFALESEVRTMAEMLSEGGYRTGAITDASLVSHTNGLDQGFTWWDQRANGLDDTLDRARDFLDADDGRPVFLFVQSYAAHVPYTVSEQTRAEYGERLDVDGKYADRLKALRAGLDRLSEGDPLPAPVAGRLAALRDLYHGAVVDVDRGFGDFLALLEERGLDRSAFTIFTSDHGEAFHEHGHLFHGAGVWEEDIRIPLLIRAPQRELAGVAKDEAEARLTAGDVTYGVSLVDLPRTVADMADLEPSPGWLGTSLLELDEERPVFTFVASWKASARVQVGMMHGKRKLIATCDPDSHEVGALAQVFDLNADPAEQHDLSAAPPPWLAPLERRLRPMARALLVPLYSSESLELTAEQEDALRMMGYTDL